MNPILNNNIESSDFLPFLSTNKNQNYNESIYSNENLLIEKDLNSNVSSLSLTQPMFENLGLSNNKDINQKTDLISIDITNDIKSKFLQKTIRFSNKNEKNRVTEQSPKDNLVRRVKKIIFDSILKYDNSIISRMYNNIGNGISIKKLLKPNHFQIKCTGTNFNKELLRKTQGEIFSTNITSKYTNYPPTHNKELIYNLLNEKDEEKKRIFNNLFSKTLLECIEHLIGKKEHDGLEGLEKIYESEMIELNEEEEYKDELKSIIKDIEKIFNEKKPRKKREKKKNPMGNKFIIKI